MYYRPTLKFFAELLQFEAEYTVTKTYDEYTQSRVLRLVTFLYLVVKSGFLQYYDTFSWKHEGLHVCP